MPALDPHLTSIFEAIVDAYDAQPAEQRERLWHVRSFGEEGFNEWARIGLESAETTSTI